MKFTKLIKNKKAISPIFASLILIAIAVIAGIVVYMFTSGTIGSLTTGGTAAQEKAAVQGVGSITNAGFDVYASYVDGGNDITINGAIIKGASGSTWVGTVTGTTDTDLPVSGDLKTLTVTVTDGTLVTGSYSVTLTSSKGGSFTSSSFIVP